MNEDGTPDRAEREHAWGLVVPFVVCQSQNGPYDDESFVAGFQAGRVDAQLHHAEIAGADGLTTMCRTALVPLLELLGMHRGFPIMSGVPIDGTPEYPPMPDWSTVTFHRGEGG